jgi:hypothetical protein
MSQDAAELVPVHQDGAFLHPVRHLGVTAAAGKMIGLQR